MAATKAANSSVAIAMAFAGRSARACDVCASKSAHWFCAADDAYLCSTCDTQVHSANALSLRHERVRLSPNGMPMKASSSHPKSTSSKLPKEKQVCDAHRTAKKLHASPPQVAPVRKRSRTSRPYSHHLKKLTQVVKSEVQSYALKAELELFDLFDADEFLVTDAGNQEVPSLSTVMTHNDSSPSSSSDLDLLSSDYEFQEGDHSASADSFAAFFKGKAAHSQKVVDDGDQFLVPDTFDEFCLDGEMSPDTTSAVVPADGNIDMSEEAFFFPGDIPGLDGFDSFVPEMDLSDEFSLSFDLALRSNGVEAFEGEAGAATHAVICKVESQPDQFAAGPFAKFFATKTKTELSEPMGPERIKREAQAMLKCCREDDVQKVPSLKLNLKDVLAAWSDRGEPWIDYKAPQMVPSEDSNSSGASDVGLVPDMDAAAAGDDSQSGGDRDARVLRYKEKRRTRLFSKKIRYEVRKLNAERRPRMKGRFVKRSTITS